MNSVDGAPNATILAEGAPTNTNINTKTTTTTAAATTVGTKTTDTTTITTPSNVINPTVADATDEFHESDKNARIVVVDDEQQQQPEQKQIQRNEAPIKQIIITTKSIRATTTKATTTTNGVVAVTMGNTNKTTIETTTTDKITTAITTTAPATTNVTTKSIQDAQYNDIPMTDMATAEGNCDGCGDGNDAAATNSTATATMSTATAVIDNTTTLAKPQPLRTTAATEGDNCELNELELCRCCGKPNVTLYDLFSNNASTLEGDTNVDATAAATIKQTTVDENLATACDIAANVAKNGAEIKNKTAVVDTTNGAATKIDESAKTNTPKRCYRTIAASIAAAAASSTNTTADSCNTGAPTCQKTNDPIAATAVNSDGVAAADRGAEVAPSTAHTSAARVKQSATVAAHADDATNNADAQGQSSDNMENILQEMQMWRLRIKSHDGLPQRICPKCAAQFYIIHKFRRKCLKVQIRLRSLFDKTKCWEYEELLARVVAEQTAEQPTTPQHSKTKSKPNNCQRLRNQETQTTDELETALSVNLPPVLDIGNDLINDNYSKSPRSGLELNVNAANAGKTSNNTASRSGNGNSSETFQRRAVEQTAIATATIRTSSPCALQKPLLGVEPTKPKTKVPNNDLMVLDVEAALECDVNRRRSGRSVDQESLLATHIIFKPATATERAKANKSTGSITTTTTTTTVMMRTRSARKRPISCQQSHEDELSLAARVEDEARADDCLAAVNDVDDDDDDEVKNEALPRTDDEVPTDAVQSVAAIAKTASLCTFPSPTYCSGEPKHAENCVQREKRARERERERGGVCECVREEERETEAEIASAAVFMDTRHAHSCRATMKGALATAAAAAILCDADTLIACCGGDCGGNVVKAIADEPLTEISRSSRHNKADYDVVDLLQPAVVVNTVQATAKDVDTSSVQQKPISGQAVTTTPTIGNNIKMSATTTVAVTAVKELTKAPTNDVQSSKQTVEAYEISNLPILPATTTNTTTCNNEAVKDGAAALQIIVSETVASKATATAAAVVDNNKGVAGNTLKSSLNCTLSLSNVQDDGCGVGGKHHLQTDKRLAAENLPVTVDADGNGDDEGVETLMATVEQRTPTTADHKANIETIKSDATAATAMISAETELLETESVIDPNSASAVSAFITKAALKAYSTSPKCRSFARRHMQHKLRRTLKGPIVQLLANSPASTSAAAAAFTAMHYKKKQLRRSLTKLTNDVDAPPVSTATNDNVTSSIAEGANSTTTTPPQSTFSYYATARRGRRRLKWRARSRLPCFDKHSRTESATTDCEVDVDKAVPMIRLPSCFVRLRRLEPRELYEEMTKSVTVTTATDAKQHTNETDVQMAPPLDKECIALKATDASEDAANTRLALKRKLPADENESTQSTRSPWRTKAEMKESLQEQTSIDDEEDLEQNELAAPLELVPFTIPTEIQKTELSLTETAYSTDGDSTTTTANGICTERRSKRIKKRRKLLEETRKGVVTQGDSAPDGKVLPIILKLVQEKRPDSCDSCSTKQTADKTNVASSSQYALPRPLTAARYHVVGNLSKPLNTELAGSESLKRRRSRPKRSCCRDSCSLTDDAATTEDEHAPNVMHKPDNTSLPPQLISQNKGKMVIDNVSILSVHASSEATKENCDNNKKSVAATSTSGTSVSSSSDKISTSQLLPSPPTSSEPTKTTTDMASLSAIKLTPTKTTPAASMSLKTFSTLMSNTTKTSLFTSPVKADIIESPTKISPQTSPAKVTALASPTSTTNANPVSVLLRNQLIVRVPLSALSADFQKKFFKTTNVQKTPIKATLSDISALTTETTKVSALTEKLTTSSQETEKPEDAETAHNNEARRESTQAKEDSNNHSDSDNVAENKAVTNSDLETTAETCIKSIELPDANSENQPTDEDHSSEHKAKPEQPSAGAPNAQFMPYNGYGCGSSQYESEQSDFMGFSDGSSPNRRVECLPNNSALYTSCAVPTISTDTPANTDNLAGAKLHDFISEFAPEFADVSEAPQANELQATLPAGEVTAALLAEAEAEAETVATQQHTQLLSETNLSEMQDVETTLSGILNEMQDQHIYTPVSSSADDFFAQSVYSPLSEPPTTPTHSMYAESPLGGVGSVGSSSMAGGGGSLSVASSPYVQHMHMEPTSVSSGQMSEPSPLPAPMSVGPPTHQQSNTQQAQGAAAGYGKQYGNKYGECFTEDSTQSELIGFQNDIPCFENIELAGAAANNASASPASSHNEQSPRDLEMRALASVSLEEATNCKVGVAKAETLQYLSTDLNACVNEANNGVQVHAPATNLPVECGANDSTSKEYAVDNAAFAQLLNDIQETERVVERARAQLQEDEEHDEVAQKKQHHRRLQHHVVPQQQQQQLLPSEGAQSTQLIQHRQLQLQQQQLPQTELLLQQQREEELLKQQQLLQQQQQQQEHLLQQKLLEQQQQEQLMQQQMLEQQRRHQQQQQQQQLLEQQRLRQRQQQQQMLEQQRKQQQQQHQHPQIIHQTMLATPKQQHAHVQAQPSQQQKQHYITLPPSCAYEAAQLQLAQAANTIQPIQNLGVGVNLYAHGLGSGQEIQWTSSADLTSLSPAIIEAPAAGGGTTTYYISASDLYQPNLIASTGMSPHLAGTPQQHGHHQQQQQQHRQALELHKSSAVDANENYIDGAAATTQHRPACQQQAQQQQQQIMIVIPQDYGKPGSNGATPQLYATTASAPEPPTTYQLSQAPQAVIMQHAQPQMTSQPLPHMSTVQVNGINLSPQFIASSAVNSAQRTLHQTPPPRHVQHYQLHNATPPPHSASAQAANRPPRCASTPSASHYQQRQQHPQQQLQLQAVHTPPQVRVLQQTRARQPGMQQLQLIQPHPQPQTAKPIATIAAKTSTTTQKVNLVCRFCHKRPKFTSNLDYSNHIIAMHPVETPFNCPHCPMHFTRRVKRQQHIVEEHGAQRFQCAQCGQSFCTQRALDQHLQRAHALEPTQPLQTPAPKQSPSQSPAVGGAQQRFSRQPAQNLATAQPAAAAHQSQQSPQRRKCFLQQRPTWLESRHRNTAMASTAAAAAAAASNAQTSMVRVEDVHLQVCDDAAKVKKSIDLQLDTTQLTAESTTTTTKHNPAGGIHTPSPSSSGGKPQRILCCPDCDDPFNEDHAHAQPCAATQQQQQQQQLQAQTQQQHDDLDQQLEDENAFEQQQQPQQIDEESLQRCNKRAAHVTLPSPEQTEPDSTSTNTATLRHFRKRRASAKLAGISAEAGGNNTNVALMASGNANTSEDELLLMERVMRNSHNCLFCDARFTNDIALRKHHQLAHSNQASMPFVCSICKRGYRIRSALQRHMESHDSEGRPYECTLCHVRFPRPSQLTLHKLTVHFLRKPHACEVCGKQFGTESALKTHSKFHAVAAPPTSNLTHPAFPHTLFITSVRRQFACSS
ncbi:mucin-17 isoform X2 [Zeugodacus cucurbitae]|uniref:mucin-17 isoform X2 n=1 Tax=Zeugodacus cucurbitae TaxID=28588 RepID=UPI0023D8FD1A|nr:mucin-17 isoform X2 [Zeugodacus cucurbitae]